MSQLTQLVEQGQQRFISLSVRERWLVLGACWALLAWLGLLIYETTAEAKINALIQEKMSLTNQINQQETVSIELNQAISQLLENSNDRKVTRLTQRLDKLNENVDQRMQTLVEPEQMSHLLLAMLERSAGLTLLELSNKAPQVLNAEEGNEPLYQHNLSLVLSGSYMSLLEYVKQLEILSGRIFWQGLEFELDQYPDANIRLEFFTISQHKELLRG